MSDSYAMITLSVFGIESVVHPTMKILLSESHLHDVQNMYEFFSSVGQ